MEKLRPEDPQRIGEFWLAGRLGSGGQGVVYEAYDPEGRRVALKVLHEVDDDSRDRFAKEAKAASRVASFCTAKVLAADLAGHRPYIVSEYVPGPSLRQAVDSGRRFTGDDLHRLATAVATALTAIHDAGVVHRDLKPGNVLLGPDGPRVIDFGIARTPDMSLSKTGAVVGTPGYLAPEVLTGQRAGPPADVFAWGATMVFAATGRNPFHADDLGGVLHRVLSHQPDLSMLPPRLSSLVAAALRKDPAARPTARDLLLALVSGDRDDIGRLLAAGNRTAQHMSGIEPADPALGTIAEEAYNALTPEERDLAAEVFLRFVDVGEDGRESCRHVSYSELLDGRSKAEAAAVHRILKAFSYVVATDGDSVYLSRPALLRAWPRLRRWMDAERDGLPVLRQISDMARLWDQNGRRDGDLLQGSRLEQALSWAAAGRRHVTLAGFEREFLRACTGLTRRRSRRRKLISATLAVLLALALTAGGVAMAQREQVARQRDIATARQAAADADRIRTTDPTTAMLLSVAAWRVSSQPETRSSLLASLQQRETSVFRDPPVQGVASRALSRDGRTLVSVSEAGVNVYDVRTGRRIASWRGLTPYGDLAQDPVLSKSGRLLAVRTWQKFDVWDLTSGRRLISRDRLQGTDGLRDVVFGEHETTLIARHRDSLEYILDVSTGRTLTAEPGALSAKAYLVDPTGERLLLTGDRFDELSLPGWARKQRYTACRTRPWVAAFSEDGEVLACVGEEGVTLLDAATGRIRSDSFEEDLDWSCDICRRDGARIRLDGAHLVAFAGRDLRVWRLADYESVLSYRAEGELTDVGLDPDGKTLRYLMDDAVVSMELAPRITSTDMGGVTKLSPDGRWAAVHDFAAGEIRLIDLRGRRQAARFPIVSEEFTMVADFDQTGARLAIAELPKRVRLFDLETFEQIWEVPAPREDAPPQGVVFSPDGRIIALLIGPTSQPGGSRVVVYDAATGRSLHDYRTAVLLDGSPIDGTRLATSNGRFFDVTTGKPVGRGFDDSYAIAPAVSSKGLMAINVDATGRIALWNVDGPTPLRPALPRAEGMVTALTFSPGGDILATLTMKGMIQLWDLDVRRRIGSAFGVNAPERLDAASLAFSADGHTLYAAVDHMLHEIPVEPGRVAAAVCERTGASLSEQDWARYLPAVPHRRVC